MKLFVFLLAIFAGIWLWKRNRIAAGKTNDPAKGTSKPMACDTGPQAMLACQHCGVHLIRNLVCQAEEVALVERLDAGRGGGGDVGVTLATPWQHLSNTLATHRNHHSPARLYKRMCPLKVLVDVHVA